MATTIYYFKRNFQTRNGLALHTLQERPIKPSIWCCSYIAVRSELVSSAFPDLDTDCELLWLQIDLTGAKSLHIGAFDRPPDSDVTTLENLNQSLQRLTHRTNGNIWLGGGGDFNAPHLNWPPLEVTPLAGTKRHIYQRLIDISLHHNIEQIIDKPTRGDNILHLFLTNNKSALQNFETLPPIGKADHDIVYIEIDARPNRQNTPQRNVFIFRNAKGPFKCYVTQMGVGGCQIFWKKRYEGVSFNVICVTRGWVGIQFPEKKRYVTLE